MALNDAAVLGPGAVTVSDVGLPFGPFKITFAGGLANTNPPQLTPDGTLLTGPSLPALAVATTRDGAGNSLQTLTIRRSGQPAALVPGADAPAALAYTAATTAADVQTYLGTIPSLAAAGSVPLVLGKAGGPYVIVISNTVSPTFNPLTQLVRVAAGSNVAATIQVEPPPATADVVADAARLETLLNALPNIGGVGGSVTVTPATSGYGFLINFGGTLANADVPALVLSFPPGVPVTGQVFVRSRGVGSLLEDSNNFNVQSFTKGGMGTLTLGGTSGYNGTTTVATGILRIVSDKALGGATGLAASGITVQSNAALQIGANITVPNGNLTLNGAGYIGDQYGSGANTGALHVLPGFTRGLGYGHHADHLASAALIGVDAGGSLALNGVVGGQQTLTKVGGGTLEFTGPLPNTNLTETTINDGTLRLNKRPGATSGQNYRIGDNENLLGAGSDVLEIASSEQLLDTQGHTVHSTGVLRTVAPAAANPQRGATAQHLRHVRPIPDQSIRRDHAAAGVQRPRCPARVRPQRARHEACERHIRRLRHAGHLSHHARGLKPRQEQPADFLRDGTGRSDRLDRHADRGRHRRDQRTAADQLWHRGLRHELRRPGQRPDADRYADRGLQRQLPAHRRSAQRALGPDCVRRQCRDRAGCDQRRAANRQRLRRADRDADGGAERHPNRRTLPALGRPAHFRHCHYPV